MPSPSPPPPPIFNKKKKKSYRILNVTYNFDDMHDTRVLPSSDKTDLGPIAYNLLSEKNSRLVILTGVFLPMDGKVIGKFMLTGVCQILPEFFLR